VFGSLAALAYGRTGSLYTAILAHVLGDTGPALAVVLPHELMGWVFVVTAELAVLGMLPLVFAVVRRQRQRWAVSLTHRS
jgi:membrane protease YdiL (CAAX protease family)